MPASENRGTSTSLKASGLEDQKGEPGKCYVEVTLKNSYEFGDGLKVQYTGALMANFQNCKREAVVDLLALLLANRPLGVRIHKNSINCRVEELQDCARLVYEKACAEAGIAPGTREFKPHELPEAPSRWLKSPPESVPDDAKEILVEFLKTFEGEVDPSALRKSEWNVFAKNLGKGQLKEFLEKLTFVEVIELPGGSWRFKVIPEEAGGMAAGIGGPGVSAAPPAPPTATGKAQRLPAQPPGQAGSAWDSWWTSDGWWQTQTPSDVWKSQSSQSENGPWATQLD